MKFTRYELSPGNREVLEKTVAYDDPRRPEFDMSVVMDASMDPYDERVWVSCLAEAWGPHPEGSLVVCEDADSGRLIAIQEPENGEEICGRSRS